MTTAASVKATSASVSWPHTTASLSFTEGSLVVVFVTNTGGATATGVGSTDDISDTFANLGPWSLVQKSAPGSVSQTAVYVFYAVAGATESGTITVATPGGSSPTDSQVSVFEVTDVDLDTPVVGTVSSAGAVSSFNLTLTEAPLAADVVMGFSASRNDNNGVTPGSGFTELVDFYAGSNPSASQFAEWKTSTTSTDVSMSGLNTVHSTGLGLIVKAPDGAEPTEVWNAYVWDGTNLLPADVFVTPDGTTLEAADIFGTAT
jgi:hypothetical protein